METTLVIEKGITIVGKPPEDHLALSPHVFSHDRQLISNDENRCPWQRKDELGLVPLTSNPNRHAVGLAAPWSVRLEHLPDGLGTIRVFMDSMLYATAGQRPSDERRSKVDVYFSADVETDGPIPGPYSILSFAIVYAGCFDGSVFQRPDAYNQVFYKELKPISDAFDPEALRINGLDRQRLCTEGEDPRQALTDACRWIRSIRPEAEPVLVAYPLSYDWTWLYWYFIRFGAEGSPFYYSRCFDIKTAVAVKAGIPISEAGRSRIEPVLRSRQPNTHHAVDDAVAQAEIFANVFEWEGRIGRTR